MANHNEYSVNRRHALEFMRWAGIGILWVASGGMRKQFHLVGRSEAAPAMTQTRPTISIIVKDTKVLYWGTVLAGARKASQDLGVNISELDAASEFDIDTRVNPRQAQGMAPAASVQFPAHGLDDDSASASNACQKSNLGVQSCRWKFGIARPGRRDAARKAN